MEPNRRDRRLRRITTRAAITIAAALTFGACVAAAPNPSYPTDAQLQAQECTFKIGILIDRSASIGDPAFRGSATNVAQLKWATNVLLDRLSDKQNNPARVYIAGFATNVLPIYQAWGGGFLDIPRVRDPFTGGELAFAQQRVVDLQFGNFNPYPLDYGTFDNATFMPSRKGGDVGRTNWQGALASVPAGANLIVVLTDGDPTWWNGARFGTNTSGIEDEDIDQAVITANAIKATGTRIVAVHFGTKSSGGPYLGWEGRISAISGPTANWDYFPTDYNGLVNRLEYIAGQLGTCTVTTTTTTAPTTTTTAAARPTTTTGPPTLNPT